MLNFLLSMRISYFTLFLISFIQVIVANEFCSKPNEHEETNKCNVQSRYSQNRYILYDVNPMEGFNLRRDVFVRVAVFVKNLIKQEEEFKWQLVLPPWGNLYHWRRENIGFQAQLPWGLFFDIPSLQKYIPVIEMYQFLQEYPSDNEETLLDVVYILQNDEEMFKTGIFKNKNEIIECKNKSLRYHKAKSKKKYIGHFWGYHNITSEYIKCVKFHGMMSNLKQNLKPNVYRSVMFDHMEIPLHDDYGTREYWKVRRSMRYNSELYDIANEYREIFLNSTNDRDKTERSDDWTKEKKRSAIGGPYLSVHLRRRDFLIGRSSTVPSIKFAASQLKKKLDELQLKVLFVATDTTEEEIYELEEHLSDYTIRRYIPSDYVLHKFKDGGVAIIDQIICSYARYFIGTHESTFTFRIQEDREIIGFPSMTTFDHLCKDTNRCNSGGQWEIVW